MIAGLKPYSAYKDSGVPWLGEVPAQWDILPGQACFREKKQANLALQEKTVLSLSYGQIVVKPPEKLHGLVPSSFETYQIVDPLNIVIRPTDLQNDQNSLRFGLSRYRGIITSAYLCFLASKRIACYLHACLKHVTRDFLTNASLRERFGIKEKNRAVVSRYIREAVDGGMIKPFDEHASRRMMKYVPFWA